MNPTKINTRPPFSDLFTIKPEVLIALTETMREEGYSKRIPPIYIWNGDAVDGHTRRQAAIDAGVTDVPIVELQFKNDLDAVIWMCKVQKDRRNLSDGELLRAIETVDRLKAKGRPVESYTENKKLSNGKIASHEAIKGPANPIISTPKKSATETANALGVSRATVERARAVSSNEEAKAQVIAGKTTLNKAYTQVQKIKKVEKEVKKEQESFKLKADAPIIQVAKLPPVETRGLHIPTPEEVEYLRLDKGPKFNEQKNSDIEWAMWSWNPVTGCNHGCTYCYARVIALGLYKQKFVPTFIPERLGAPRNTKVPDLAATEIGWKNVFVCSMADLWGKWVPAKVIEYVMREVHENPKWNYLFLTKFPDRYLEFDFPAHTWVGTSVDTQAAVKRAETSFEKLIKQGHKGVRWLSVEPMLEPLKFSNLSMFNWLVVGGQSAWDDNGLKVDEFVPPFRWYHDLIKQADDAGIPVYMKANLHVRTRTREYPYMA